MDSYQEVQARLHDAWLANRLGSRTPHVLIGLPSLSLSQSMLQHYATRLPALEHRFLLLLLVLGRIPSCEGLLVTCGHPTDGVLDYYARLASPEDPEDVRRRLRVLVVDDGSHRGVAAKLLDRPDLMEEIRSFVAGRPALIEPWNVTEHEVDVAVALGVPLNGTAPGLWPLGFKSAGRRMFHETGVPTPLGLEHVRDLAGVAEAIRHIRRARPRLTGVVVKHDNSAAGDGNWIVRTRDPDGHRIPLAKLRDEAFAELPDWFKRDLAEGGVVEELIAGSDFSSPSAQVEITPDGGVRLLSTHEQVLGGDTGQVYTGCVFPADGSYAGELAEHGRAVGEWLARAGAVGRLAVDFVAVRRRRRWQVFALEVNLRKGGTTHPFSVLRHLAPGQYDAATGVWHAESDGLPRYYRSTDNLLDESWLGLEPLRVIEAVADAGLEFDRDTGTGVVVHMLSCLAVDGRCGLTAIGRSRDEADELFAAAGAAIDRASASVPGRRYGTQMQR
jgi:hypothetical protein